MLNQMRDEVANIVAGDIVRLHGHLLVASAPASVRALAYGADLHTVGEVTGVAVHTQAVGRPVAVPDQRVTVVR